MAKRARKQLLTKVLTPRIEPGTADCEGMKLPLSYRRTTTRRRLVEGVFVDLIVKVLTSLVVAMLADRGHLDYEQKVMEAVQLGGGRLVLGFLPLST